VISKWSLTFIEQNRIECAKLSGHVASRFQNGLRASSSSRRPGSSAVVACATLERRRGAAKPSVRRLRQFRCHFQLVPVPGSLKTMARKPYSALGTNYSPVSSCANMRQRRPFLDCRFHKNPFLRYSLSQKFIFPDSKKNF